jgi:hypothetical protein
LYFNVALATALLTGELPLCANVIAPLINLFLKDGGADTPPASLAQ